jgi:hypothetical protein
MRISSLLKETKVLFLVGLIDLLLTLVLFTYFTLHPECSEFNADAENVGFFRMILAKSSWMFALAKLVNLWLCLGIIEFARQRKLVEERMAKKYLKIAIVAYIVLYFYFVIRVNIVPLLQ